MAVTYKQRRARNKYRVIIGNLNDEEYANSLPKVEKEILKDQAYKLAKEAGISSGRVDEDLGVPPPRVLGSRGGESKG